VRSRTLTVTATIAVCATAIVVGGLAVGANSAEGPRYQAVPGFGGTIARIVSSPWWIAEATIQYNSSTPARFSDVEVRAFGDPLWGRAIVADDGTPGHSRGVVSGAVTSVPDYPSVWDISPHYFAANATLVDTHTYSLVIYFQTVRTSLVGGFTSVRFTLANESGAVTRQFNVVAYECGGEFNGSWKCDSLQGQVANYAQHWVSLLAAPTKVLGEVGT
jgi:hypothetical protein